MAEVYRHATAEMHGDYPYFRGLWNRVVLALLGAAFLPLLVIGGGLTTLAHGILKDRLLEAVATEVGLHREEVDQYLEARVRDLRLLARHIPLATLGSPEGLAAVFASFREERTGFQDLGVIDSQGRHRAYAGPYDLMGRNYREAPWFREVMLRGVYISDVFLGFRGVPHFVLAVRQDDPAGPWILRATVDGASFDRLVSAISDRRRGRAYLLNLEGRYQTTPPAGLTDPAPAEGLAQVPAEALTREERGPRVVFRTGLRAVPWVLVAEIEEAALFAPLRRLRHLSVYVFVLSGFLIVGTVLLTTNALVSRLEAKRRSIHKLDRQLRAANRMASAMDLARGLFTDLKEKLANIDTAAAWLGEGAAGDGAQGAERSASAQIRQEARRGREAIERFLAFTRESEALITVVDVHALLDELAALLEKELFFRRIILERDFQAAPPTVRSDPAQLRQVFQNLVANAAAAVERNGRITLATVRTPQGLQVTVADTGPGIPPENLERIFDPLFTTKKDGTGLGLPICREILTRLGGRLEVACRPGAGAVFRVELPERLTEVSERVGEG
jgi:two-component system NtrC family sensor kinase